MSFIKAVLLLPVGLAIFIGLGAFAFCLASWYEAGVASDVAAGAWCAWPWHWPGIRVAHAFQDTINTVVDRFVAPPASTGFLEGIGQWFQNFMGGWLAMVINVLVVALPLDLLFRILAWVFETQKPHINQIEEIR